MNEPESIESDAREEPDELDEPVEAEEGFDLAPLDLQGLVRDLNEALVLAAVRDGPKHGYQIALDVSERTGGLFAFQHGTLYPILHRLEKAGLLSGAWSAGAGRRRKEYRLTADGRQRLAAEGERMVRVLDVVRGVLEGSVGR